MVDLPNNNLSTCSKKKKGEGFQNKQTVDRGKEETIVFWMEINVAMQASPGSDHVNFSSEQMFMGKFH